MATSNVHFKPHQHYAQAVTRQYDLDSFKNGSFINDESNDLWRAAFPFGADKKAAFARLWLIKRMEALQQRPPPTLEKALGQWKAAMEFSQKLDDSRTASLSGHDKRI